LRVDIVTSDVVACRISLPIIAASARARYAGHAAATPIVAVAIAATARARTQRPRIIVNKVVIT
jgi:hypothetical protein